MSSIKTTEWKVFYLKDLFLPIRGKRLTINDRKKGNIPFITAGENNNGVSDYIDNDVIIYKDKITIDMFCNCFYQPYNFACDDNIIVLDEIDITKNISPFVKLFIVSTISQDKYRFEYGRQYRIKNFNTHQIKLPSTKHGIPDWKFMEDYIKSLKNQIQSLYKNSLETKNQTKNSSLDTNNWKYFLVQDFFDVKLAKGDLKNDECENGFYPLISSGINNFGILCYTNGQSTISNKKDSLIFKKNSITLDMFCNAFYRDKDFYAVSHGRVNILKPKTQLNKFHLLFITTLLNNEKFKFSYGRAVYSNTIKDMKIKLPVASDNTPDWKFMENYIKSLPYGDCI
ncbi:restriction endonuclease subunit S [Campylobacter lari]|nr:restriction endonuclease subunit S [Campylobacter lari]